MNSEKQVVKKKVNIKRKDTVNKQTSTNDPHEPEEINEIEKPKIPVKKISKIENLKKKTDEYNNTLITINKKLENERNNTLNSLNQINDEIKGKNKEIKNLEKENKSLFLDLKRIQSEVDKQFKMVRINRLDENELEKKK